MDAITIEKKAWSAPKVDTLSIRKETASGTQNGPEKDDINQKLKTKS